MPVKEHLSDEFIASLLAKDAKASNIKYSSYGLQELLPKRPTLNAPKPNTRFLQNIIRETDSHNFALRAKEIADSRSRLRKLHRGDRLSSPEDDHGRLSREDDHRSKRRQVDRSDDPGVHASRSHRKANPQRDKDKHSRSHYSERRHRDAPYDDDDDVKEHPQLRRREKHHHHRSHRHRSRSSTSLARSRSRSPPSERKHHHRRPHPKSRSKRSQSPDDGNRKLYLKSNGTHKPPKPLSTHLPAEPRLPSPSSSSDPLESLIGPPPPPPEPRLKSRGRGTFASTSAIDAHFSSTYDPSIDIQPNPDIDIDDDWDMALEALRDRQKWQKQGAERLKAAGFTEEEVEKWEKGGERTEEDVKWRGRGEGREWDRGKVVGEEGVETRSEWGRLKGT